MYAQYYKLTLLEPTDVTEFDICFCILFRVVSVAFKIGILNPHNFLISYEGGNV